MINTILFDLDGTLIDTNELIIASFTHTLKKHTGKTYRREDILPFIGPPLKDSLASVKADEVDQMIETYREHNIKNHDAYVTIYKTVKETIKTLHEQGYHLAIVTTKITETAKLGLKMTGLLPYFDVIIGLDEVTHAKPHPEPVLKALEALGVSNANALMVGDNSHDIQAGQNAGTKTAGVSWSIKGEDYLLSFKPDYMLKELKDILAIVDAD